MSQVLEAIGAIVLILLMFALSVFGLFLLEHYNPHRCPKCGERAYTHVKVVDKNG